MLLIITGKTASGKDTLITKILEKYSSFRKVLTTTSRNPREGESNGIDYNFISQEEFQQKINQEDFLEYVEYGDNFYGTEKLRLSSKGNLIWRIDPSMAGKAKEVFPDCIVIYITVGNRTILERLKERGLSASEIEKRMQDDKTIWQKYGQNYDFIIENKPGKLDEAISQVCQIIDLKMPK